MALSNEDLLAISQLLDTKLEPINKRLDNIEKDITDIKVDIRRTSRKSTLILDEVERVHDILTKT